MSAQPARRREDLRAFRAYAGEPDPQCLPAAGCCRQYGARLRRAKHEYEQHPVIAQGNPGNLPTGRRMTDVDQFVAGTEADDERGS